MVANMKDMERMRGGAVVLMMPRHQEALGGMIQQMERERQGQLAADASWSALADSVRGDMSRMGRMSVDDVRAMLAAHRDRVTRLIEMHRAGTATPAGPRRE